MQNGRDAARCQLPFEITDQEALGVLLIAQSCIHVAHGESPYKQLSLIPRTELRNRPHLPRDPSQLSGEPHFPNRLVYLLDIVQEVQMVGPAQNDHLFCRWRPFKQLVHPGEWERNILLGDQIERRNVAIPVESKSYLKNSRLCLGASGWGEGHHRSDAPVSFSCRERRPTSEAVSHDSNPSGIHLNLRTARRTMEQMIEEKTYIRHTVRDPSLGSGSLLFLGLIVPGCQIRADDLGMVQGRDNIPVAAQVRAERRGTPPILPTRMRENDQRVGSGLGHRIAHRQLASQFAGQWNGEDVLGFWRNVLSRMPGVRGVPDFTGKESIARCIECLNGAHTSRKSTPSE